MEYSLYWDETGQETQANFDYLLEVAVAALRNDYRHVTLRREGLAILVVRPMNEVRVHWTPDTTKAEKAFVVNANPSLKGIPTMPYEGEASEGPLLTFELGYTYPSGGAHVYRQRFQARSWVKASLHALERERTLRFAHSGVKVTEIKLVQ